MIHYQSSKWRLFGSRPTSILKRDFLQWTYLSVNKISGLKLTKLIAIGDGKEMDLFVNKKEDSANYQQVIKHYRDGKIEKVFAKYKKLIKNYQPYGQDLPEQSLNALKDIGPILIYSFYVERLADLEKGKRHDKLIKTNGQLRYLAAETVYPLYDRAHKRLVNKFRNKSIDNYTIKELLNILSTNKIEQREKNYIFFGTKRNTKIYIGEAAKKFLRQHLFAQLKSNKAKELKGLPAYLGKVRGKVKIVRGLADAKNCAGKIFVCRETIIEYAPYLKKVLGLVTDIGGINSHAAIIAREFKIPCVVGTNFATQILHDGDIVEVDANKGTIKVIKK